MQKYVTLVVLFIGSVAFAGEFRISTGSLTLEACYRLALARSESVALTEEDIAREEARFGLLRSGVLPDVGFLATDRFQDTSGVSSGSNSTFTRGDRPEAAFYARQPIFAGFREFAAMKGQKAEILASQESVFRSKILLYEDVARLFYMVTDRDREIESLKTLIKLSRDRIDELKKRVAIGRSREGEVLSTESQSANLESRLEAAKGFREASLEVLNTLLGVQATSLLDDQPEATVPAPLEHYLDRLVQRPDIMAAEARRQARTHFTESARRRYWPTLDVAGNYYVKRVGFNEPIDWDVLFTLDAPFFTGGETKSLIRQAESEERASTLTLSETRRNAEREVRERHRNLRSLLAQIQKLRRSAELAKRNYAVQQKEYRLGLVNNLDVLSALNTWQESQVALDTTLLAAKNVALRLELAAGRPLQVTP
jgi:outer membrane protein